MKVPIVTIVGRPNVGKSTLFNKIIGSRVAITAEEAGTTRDRLFHKIQHPVMDFFLVDTGGLEFGKGETTIEDDMQAQSRVAIEEADLIVFVVDSKNELTRQDFSAAEILRKKGNKKPVFLVVNKCDHFMDEGRLAPFYSLGFDPHQVSALHRTGVEMLLDEVIEALKGRHFLSKDNPEYQKALEQEEKQANIAMVGKPNVGKSSLINALLNKEKLIVSDIPGTTRDSTDSLIRHKGKEYNFIDTAGLKRPGKTGRGIEKFSSLRSMAAIERCDVTLLVLDSSREISHQDQQIANVILQAGKGLVLLINKWDIKEDDEDKEEKRRLKYLGKLKHKFVFLPWAPVIFTSAVTKKNFNPIFEQIELAVEEGKKRVPTAQLNAFMEKLIMEHGPTGKTRIKPKIYYITQAETRPPHFLLFVNKKSAFHFSYLRYVENRIREKFAFTGTPLKLEYREKEREESR